jgi:hypothetical protein
MVEPASFNTAGVVYFKLSLGMQGDPLVRAGSNLSGTGV